MAQNLILYQGQDWSQQLSYFQDANQTEPLVFSNPVMDVRDADGGLLATFDTTGDQAGLITSPSDGVIVLTMGHATTPSLPAGTYGVDIFADVAGTGPGTGRQPITERGVIALQVIARITVDA